MSLKLQKDFTNLDKDILDSASLATSTPVVLMSSSLSPASNVNCNLVLQQPHELFTLENCNG